MTLPTLSVWESAFDTKSALSGFYLWLLFGLLSISVSCDIQKWISDRIWFRHLMGIIAFFFLFAVIDTTSSDYHVGMIWTKTLLVYGVFLLMTKSRAYFSIPVLLLLVIDQSLKSQKGYLEKKGQDASRLDCARSVITLLMSALIVLGFVDYVFHQKQSHGDKFSLSKLVFGYGCKN